MQVAAVLYDKEKDKCKYFNKCAGSVRNFAILIPVITPINVS